MYRWPEVRSRGTGLAPPRRTTPNRLSFDPSSLRALREIILGPLDAAAGEANSEFQPKDSWEQQQAADQADEARLKRKLVICRACLAGESVRDDTASSVSR